MKERDPFYLILIGFFTTLLIYNLNPGNIKNHSLIVYGIHVHHFSYGIIILAIIGYLSLNGFKCPPILGFLYGLGLFFVSDEFSMWLKLQSEGPNPLRQVGNITMSLVLLSILMARFFKKPSG